MITPKQISYTSLVGIKTVRIVPPKTIPRTLTNGQGQVRTTSETKNK